MRVNKFVAQATGISRRAADSIILEGRVRINGQLASAGQDVDEQVTVTLSGKALSLRHGITTIMLNKPVGYVCSRNGQGSKTIYDLLPPELHHLKPVGRLDKDSSGLLLLTNDGELANHLTHPSFRKQKIYQVELDKALTADDKTHLERGVPLDDGPSALRLSGQNKKWTITIAEGRNRQIRRTFAALGYKVITLHRTEFGEYILGNLKASQYVAAKKKF